MTKSQQLRAEMAREKIRYLHVSVLVGSNKMRTEEGFEMMVPTRTPKGKGATATRKISKQAIRLARKEVKRELRRQAQSAR